MIIRFRRLHLPRRRPRSPTGDRFVLFKRLDDGSLAIFQRVRRYRTQFGRKK